MLILSAIPYSLINAGRGEKKQTSVLRKICRKRKTVLELQEGSAFEQVSPLRCKVTEVAGTQRTSDRQRQIYPNFHGKNLLYLQPIG